MILGEMGFELIEDVAPRIGVAPSTLREWCRRDAFPHMRFAGKRRVFIRRDWVQAWADGAVELEVVRHSGGGKLVRPIGVSK